MTYLEPKFSKSADTSAPNPYQGRWRWWYSAIADAMIRNPDKKIQDIAVMLGKHPNTVSMITNTDLFKEYLAQRKAEWAKDHDHAIRAKLTDVVSEGLDIMLDQLRSKKGQIPMPVITKVVEGTLDRLGYAPNTGPSVVVDNRQIDARQQTVQIAGLSASDLEAAREALRLSEQRKASSSLAPPPPVTPALEEQEAGPLLDGEVL